VFNIEQPRPVKAPKQHANLRRDKRDDVAVAVIQIKVAVFHCGTFFTAPSRIVSGDCD
jgi:hypothetical protein